jgi:undecaprenyl-diphosphatase
LEAPGWNGDVSMEFLVAFDKGVFFAFDNSIIPQFGNSGLNEIMIFCTHLGDPWTLRGALLVGVAGLATGGRFRSAVLALATFLLATGLSDGTKGLVRRERPAPANWVVPVPSSYSFPSGHALESTALYGTLALLAARGCASRKAKYSLIGGSLLLVGLIGFSRVYLSVHFTSDVIGGWAAGWALTLACAWVDQRWQSLRPHATKEALPLS